MPEKSNTETYNDVDDHFDDALFCVVIHIPNDILFLNRLLIFSDSFRKSPHCPRK